MACRNFTRVKRKFGCVSVCAMALEKWKKCDDREIVKSLSSVITWPKLSALKQSKV